MFAYSYLLQLLGCSYLTTTTITSTTTTTITTTTTSITTTTITTTTTTTTITIIIIIITRYCSLNITRIKRLCNFCNKNEVEDEFHLLFSCEIYTSFRHALFQKLRSIISNLNVDNKEEFTKQIFCTTDNKAIFYISNYICKCISKRKSLPLH